jgi:hypothetical protein
MIILYLFLGHFVADFLLQPHALVAWKNRSWVGVLVHATVHFLTTGLFLYLYTFLLSAWIPALILAVAHFFIDLMKSSHQKTARNSSLLYWFDQLLHYLSILLVFWISQLISLPAASLNNFFTSFFYSPAAIVYLNLAIFVSLGIEYSFYRDNHQLKQKKPSFNRRQLVTRLFLFTLIYIGLLFALPMV